ncbi:MAG: hypothetical protein V4628_13270, partial [Pseudomonadota bacterium]
TSLASLLFVSGAYAEDKVIREYSFDLADVTEVEFQGSVGSMDFIESTGTELKLVLVIESNEEGWFGGDKDVSDVELESRVRNGRLVLEMEEEETTTEWTVQLPAVATTSIHMGVGEIKGEFGATELDVELGVGEVDVEVPLASAGDIDISVGVGDASLRGASDEHREKAFVSQDIHGNGEGDQEINVEIGVGDASVSLN